MRYWRTQDATRTRFSDMTSTGCRGDPGQESVWRVRQRRNPPIGAGNLRCLCDNFDDTIRCAIAPYGSALPGLVLRDAWLTPSSSGSGTDIDGTLARLIVLELVFLVDLLALVPARRLFSPAERSGHVRFARGVRVARACPRGDFRARDGGGFADEAPGGAAHQVDVDVIIVIGVGAWREHGCELLAGRALDVAQKTLLFGKAMPAVLHRDVPAVGEREGGDVERVAEGVLGNMRVRIAVHAAAGIGGDLLDLDHARAEPALRRRLHRLVEPVIERRDDRTGQRRRGSHRHRTDRGDGIALRGSERRQAIRLRGRRVGMERSR